MEPENKKAVLVVGGAVPAQLAETLKEAGVGQAVLHAFCSAEGCGQPATLSPVLKWTACSRPSGPWAQAKMDLPVCAEHADPTVGNWVSDDGWKSIVAAVRKAGGSFPDRKSLKVEFEPIGPGAGGVQ